LESREFIPREIWTWRCTHWSGSLEDFWESRRIWEIRELTPPDLDLEMNSLEWESRGRESRVIWESRRIWEIRESSGFGPGDALTGVGV
jgi:hypothetical protein